MTATDYEALPALAEEAPAPSAGTVVMKFGGTSVADVDRLRAVAQRLVAAREAGNRVVAVLSAMGDTTDELVRLAHEISPRPEARELDMLISVGERISCSLCAMAIHDLGHEAISLTGSQAGIVTDTAHGKAKIVDIRANRIHEALDKERIVLVAGFQGVSTELRHHDARPRRLGHDCRRARGSARRRRLRDLHGRRRRPHRRPADRPERAQAARGQLRRDAGDGRLGRTRAPAAVGRVRAQPRCQAARPVELLGGRRHLDSRGGRTDAREGAHLRRHAQARRRRSTGSRACPRRGSSRPWRRRASTSTP